jgi:hypothetical protein
MVALAEHDVVVVDEGDRSGQTPLSILEPFLQTCECLRQRGRNHRTTLLVVRIEKTPIRLAADDHSQLPSEVMGVVDARIAPEGACWRHKVRGISNQETATLPKALSDIGRHFPRACIDEVCLDPGSSRATQNKFAAAIPINMLRLFAFSGKYCSASSQRPPSRGVMVALRSLTKQEVKRFPSMVGDRSVSKMMFIQCWSTPGPLRPMPSWSRSVPLAPSAAIR